VNLAKSTWEEFQLRQAHLKADAWQLLQNANERVEHEGLFEDAANEEERVFRPIILRRGQADFRNQLLLAYDCRCAVTGCDARDALEAAHIVSYCELQSYRVSDGLPLRADIHTLFDLNLLGVNPVTLAVELAPALRDSSYRNLHGKSLRKPNEKRSQPSADALKRKWDAFVATNGND
jgi:predicted restriction endonuclease